MILNKRIRNSQLDVTHSNEEKHNSAGWRPKLGIKPNSSSSLQVQTARFGNLIVNEEVVLTFPEGLIGNDKSKRFIVVRHAENSPFRWLQSLNEPNIAYPIIEPDQFRPDYAPTISEGDALFLKLDKSTLVLLFVIVTVPPENPQALTGNLLGPIVINTQTRQGRQVIVQDEGYFTRHPLYEEIQRMQTLNYQKNTLKKAA